MGKKGSWFSAIKRVFIPRSKENPSNESDKRSGKEKKKKGLRKLRRGETDSFTPLFREPSSIEKILGEAEREHKIVFRPPTPPEHPPAPPFVAHKASSSPHGPSQRIASPRIASPPRAPSPPSLPRVASPEASPPKVIRPRPEPTLRNHHASATKIQAAYRGYMARRSFRAWKGLVRLQGVVRGQTVKRQTTTAMKHMQLLVRVQSQIQSRRIEMLENQARQQARFKNDKEVESALGKLTFGQACEAGNEDWDDSLLTKEEIEARMQRKVEAVIKRERAMAYAHSHLLWKTTMKSVYAGVSDIRTRGPWWWNWLERQLSSRNAPEGQSMKDFKLTPTRPNSELKPSPKLPSSSKQHQFMFDNMDTPTPKSTRSTMLPTTGPMQTPSRILQESSSALSKYSRPRASGVDSQFDLPLKDDDSLTSCPPFSVPNYMTPTVSAKAKARGNSNTNGVFVGTPGSEASKRRLSSSLTQGIGSFKWSRGSSFSGKDHPSTQRGLDKNQSLHSMGNFSVDSTVSMPATVGRKPFNRFV
ncbi:Protein IQ-DOMAIN 14 [Hibiscus syriacus]|uniref:Protein IQ-DOMAIN 14 n=1 Tax=Hibiscus syriacus TaxID=106335 RepID=A0A6A2WR51_HIBSY|nr:protein IQ-DOMAIN 14-like [Hibiscus syriacus]XP_039045605.1 protein IQ-DOMAIN 14-like [Hibiscus syriacus]KAE8663098.1 Protein IQ-DOMAIN 14 [Hibiscus syriacus]